MEDPPVPASSDRLWVDQFACALNQQRSRVEEFLALQRARRGQAEAELTRQIEEIIESAERSRAETAGGKQEIDACSQQLDRQIEILAGLNKELDARQADWQRAHQQAQDEQAARSAEIRSQHEEHIAALSAQVQRQIDQQYQQIEQQLEKLHAAGADMAELNVELEAGRRREADLDAELDTVRRRCQQLEQDAVEARAATVDREVLDALRAERDELARRLGECEQRLAAAIDRLSEAEDKLATSTGGPGDTNTDDFRRRYELAMDDLRELKQRNKALEAEVAKAHARGGSTADSSGRQIDWESEKRRILEALEADLGESDEDQASQRTEIEAIVDSTDRIVAEKNEEINELKQLLEAQNTGREALAVGAAAVGQVLDQDAVIQEERENLRRLRHEWEEKLRRAEIDNSIERAKMARERTELEEKIRAYQEHCGAADAQPGPAGEAAGPSRAKRGRWLARLGLKDE